MIEQSADGSGLKRACAGAQSSSSLSSELMWMMRSSELNTASSTCVRMRGRILESHAMVNSARLGPWARWERGSRASFPAGATLASEGIGVEHSDRDLNAQPVCQRVSCPCSDKLAVFPPQTLLYQEARRTRSNLENLRC